MVDRSLRKVSSIQRIAVDRQNQEKRSVLEKGSIMSKELDFEKVIPR